MVLVACLIKCKYCWRIQFNFSDILLSYRLILNIYINDINSLIDARIITTGDSQIVQFINITTVYTDLFEVCNAIVDLAYGYIT
ncbi:MAG: hypothetical protein QXQ74_06065 [Desulfurococcaceae archaeon]